MQEGLVAAPAGSLFLRSDGGVAHYQKRSGVGNTGWIGSGSGYRVLQEIAAFMGGQITDHRIDRLPNAFRRIVEYRRPIGGGDINNVVAEKSINTTGAGYCLRYLNADYY